MSTWSRNVGAHVEVTLLGDSRGSKQGMLAQILASCITIGSVSYPLEQDQRRDLPPSSTRIENESLPYFAKRKSRMAVEPEMPPLSSSIPKAKTTDRVGLKSCSSSVSIAVLHYSSV